MSMSNEDDLNARRIEAERADEKKATAQEQKSDEDDEMSSDSVVNNILELEKRLSYSGTTENVSVLGKAQQHNVAASSKSINETALNSIINSEEEDNDGDIDDFDERSLNLTSKLKSAFVADARRLELNTHDRV